MSAVVEAENHAAADAKIGERAHENVGPSNWSSLACPCCGANLGGYYGTLPQVMERAASHGWLFSTDASGTLVAYDGTDCRARHASECIRAGKPVPQPIEPPQQAPSASATSAVVAVNAKKGERVVTTTTTVPTRELRQQCRRSGCKEVLRVHQSYQQDKWSPDIVRLAAHANWIEGFCSGTCLERAAFAAAPPPVVAVEQVPDVSYQRARAVAVAQRGAAERAAGLPVPGLSGREIEVDGTPAKPRRR